MIARFEIPHCEFDTKTFQKTKTKANMIKVITLITLIILCLIIFGIRDNWFTECSQFIIEDYLLYFLLTFGLFISDICYKNILEKKEYFINTSENISKEEFQKRQLDVIKELANNPTKLSQYITAANLQIEQLQSDLKNTSIILEALLKIKS